VRLVGSGQSIRATARLLNIAEQSLFHWVKAQRKGRLQDLGATGRSALNRGKSVAYVRNSHKLRGSAKFWEKPRCTSPRAKSEVRLYSPPSATWADPCARPGPGRERDELSRALSPSASREGWALDEDSRRDWVIDAFQMAWLQRQPGRNDGLIFHCDRGSQYASQAFQQVLRQGGVQESMSRKGKYWDTDFRGNLIPGLGPDASGRLLPFGTSGQWIRHMYQFIPQSTAPYVDAAAFLWNDLIDR
jgi:transposase-like protein